MLNLQHNQLSGPLPGSLNFLRQLASFNASHNALEGPLPASIAQLPNLKALDLSHNRIAGGLVTEMGNYSALENMDLHGNALTGPLPITFAPPNLPLLTFLDLSENQLKRAHPLRLRQHLRRQPGPAPQVQQPLRARPRGPQQYLCAGHAPGGCGQATRSSAAPWGTRRAPS